MPWINRGGHSLLIKTVKESALQNQLTEAVTIKMTASINTHISGDGPLIKTRLD